MPNNQSIDITWIKIGIIAGFLTTIIYPLLIFAPMPRLLSVILIFAVGPLLSISSVGLYKFIQLHRKTVSLQIAMVSNIIAGTLFCVMLVVQMALRFPMLDHIERTGDESVREIVNWIWNVDLGLDLSWDLYIALGTFFFALNMLRHPKLGKVIGGIGILVTVAMLGFNIYTFPDPPADAGLFDLGPFVGLWYLLVTILVLRSYNWAKKLLSIEDSPNLS